MVDSTRMPIEGARPLRRVEYEQLVRLGCFEGEHVELLYGTVVSMSPHGPTHDAVIERLTRLLVTGLGDRASVRIQSAFAASDGSEPEPDVAVVPLRDHDDAHPGEAWLLIEVAESSLATDRGVKATLYAECGVPEYWVVNIVDGLVEVHDDPVNRAYARVTPYRPGEVLAPGRFPDLRIAVSAILR